MARRRCQNPTPRVEGRKWVLYYWSDEFENGKRVRKKTRQVLAEASMRFREVQKVAQEFLRPINQGLVAVGSATKFADYVDRTYVPVLMEAMAKSTQDRYRGVIEKYLKPRFGGLCLRDVNVLAGDQFMVELGKGDLEYESIDKVRDVLSSVMKSAVRYGLMVTNPMDGVRPPRPKKGKKVKPWITREQFENLVVHVQEPYATMLYTAAYTGLRVSEVVGLRWRNVGEDSITVEERYCRGEWGAPKSEASNATVPVNRAVVERIHRLRLLTVEVKAGRATRRYRVVKSDEPDDLV